MALPDAVTREELYMKYLTGDTSIELPLPITRKEIYLYYLCQNGTGGSAVTPEQIESAVNKYLSENPVQAGATEEQAKQINENKDNIEKKLDKNQGTENSGKILGINELGNIVPQDAPEDGSGSTVSVSVSETVTGDPGTTANVENVGDSQKVKLKFTIPKGEQGPQGPAGESGAKGDPGANGKSATIRVGNVTTGDAVKVTNSGTETDAVFDFEFPEQGAPSQDQIEGAIKEYFEKNPVSSDTKKIDHGTGDSEFTITPNVQHVWGEMESLNLTLEPGGDGVSNVYWFSFVSGQSATQLTLPETVINDLAVQPNTRYEISILDNYMVYSDWSVM